MYYLTLDNVDDNKYRYLHFAFKQLFLVNTIFKYM